MGFPLSIVVAVAENGVIGKDNTLIWRLQSDLKRFRQLTWGRPLIMGRKTFQSIGKPLPGRISIVLTRDAAFSRDAEATGVRVARNWDEALEMAQYAANEMGAEGVCVIGGAEIYALALPVVQTIHLTEVHASPEGDTIFPYFNRDEFSEILRQPNPATENDDYPFTFIDLQRKDLR